jgi:hypothetical protein
MAIGGLIGGLGGAGSALAKATHGPLDEQLAHAINALPRIFR